MGGYKIWDIRLRATSGHVWSIGTTNLLVGKIWKKYLRKYKTKATVPSFVKLLALICLQLRHIFINPVISFHSKFQIFKGYHQSKLTEVKEKQELLRKGHATAYSEIRAMIQKQVLTEHKVLPLSGIDTLMNCKNKINQTKNFGPIIWRKGYKRMLKLHLLSNFLKLNGKAVCHFGLISRQICQLKKL